MLAGYPSRRAIRSTRKCTREKHQSWFDQSELAQAPRTTQTSRLRASSGAGATIPRWPDWNAGARTASSTKRPASHVRHHDDRRIKAPAMALRAKREACRQARGAVSPPGSACQTHRTASETLREKSPRRSAARAAWAC